MTRAVERSLSECLDSWHQRDSCEQDEDIHQISDQGDTRSHLKGQIYAKMLLLWTQL